MVVIVLIVLILLATRGILTNQTDTMIRIDGQSFDTFSQSPQQPGSNVSLDALSWNLTSKNGILSDDNGKLLVSSYPNHPNSTVTVVAETIGLGINLTETPVIYVNASCDLGTQWIVSIGWPGWNPVNGSEIVENLSSYPYLYAGLETKYDIIWLNSNYPSSSNPCTDRPQLLRINALNELSELGLSNLPEISGLQVKQVIPSGLQGPMTIYVSSIFSQTEPAFYESVPSDGTTSALVDGSIVFTSDSTRSLLKEGWYPTRTYLRYSMNAASGTEYVIFEAMKVNSTLLLVRDPFIFRHTTSSVSIGTFVDFVSPNLPRSNLEPLASLSSNLSNGDMALLFTPITNGTITKVTLEFVQKAWSELPFGGMRQTFSLPVPSNEVLVGRGIELLLLTVITPVALLATLGVLLLRNKPLRSRNALFLVIAAGLVLRLLAAPFYSSNDTENFAAVSSIYYSVGALASEWVSLPGFVYLQTINYLPYALLRQVGFGDFTYLAQPIFVIESLVIKIPAILADLGIAYFLYKIAKGMYPDQAKLIVGLYLLNPLTVYVSGVYGQFDGIFSLLVLLGLYYTVARHNIRKGGVLLGASSLILPVGFAAIFPQSLELLKRKNWKGFLLLGGISLSTLVLGILPIVFESRSPIILTSEERFLHAIPGESIVEGSFPFSVYGLGLWSSIGYGLNYRFLLQLWGYSVGSAIYPIGAGLGFLALTFLLLRASKGEASGSTRFSTSLLYFLGVVALFQLTYPTVFLQFAVWVAVFTLATYTVTRKPAFLASFLGSSLLAGIPYVAFVDSPVAKATGIPSVLILNATDTNIIWSVIGVTYSVIMAIILCLSIRGLVSRNHEEGDESRRTGILQEEGNL